MELEEDTRECKSDSEKWDKETEESDRTPSKFPSDFSTDSKIFMNHLSTNRIYCLEYN